MPDPFITPGDLVDYLGRGGTADPAMLIVTDAACDMIRTLTELTFNQATTTITMDGPGRDTLLLPELPVNSVGTITVNGTAEPNYAFNSNGIVFRGAAGAFPRPVWTEGRQNITLTYSHGYAEADLPRDVRMVALSVAARMAVQGVAGEESIGAVRVKYPTAATDFTSGELRILRKYKPTRTS